MVVFLLAAILLVLLIATGLHVPVFAIALKALKWALIAAAVVVVIALLIHFFPKFDDVSSKPFFNFDLGFDFGDIIKWGSIVGFCVFVPYVLIVCVYDFVKFIYEKVADKKKLPPSDS